MKGQHFLYMSEIFWGLIFTYQLSPAYFFELGGGFMGIKGGVEAFAFIGEKILTGGIYCGEALCEACSALLYHTFFFAPKAAEEFLLIACRFKLLPLIWRAYSPGGSFVYLTVVYYVKAYFSFAYGCPTAVLQWLRLKKRSSCVK